MIPVCNVLPRLEAELLWMHVLGISREQLWAWPDRPISLDQQAAVQACFQRRVQGEPVAYIVGEKPFWDMRLKVTKDTLIPRPETELLVEKILERYSASSCLSLLDIGTGSGAIALAIARERPNWRITALDVSAPALMIAKENAKQYKVDTISFIHSDLFSVVQERFDVIVSNPPYIKEQDEHLTQGDVRFEPLLALVSGAQGLDIITRIIREAPNFLHPQGLLAIEHGYDQAAKVRQLFADHSYTALESFTDLAGIERVSWGTILNRLHSAARYVQT